MAKQTHYRLVNILKTMAQYLLLLGERSNGKSYAVKEHCLIDAYENGNEFVYLRRWREDIKGEAIAQYFEDMKENSSGGQPIREITRGEWECVTVYRSGIYFAKYEDDKLVRSPKKIGHTMCLTGETHYKSLAFPKVANMIFEEFITDKGYLTNEVKTLVSLVSTVFRRNTGRIFMIGNTISQVCPYFTEWELYHVLKMEQGTIDIYNQETTQQYEDGTPVVVKIAVEYCANSGNNSQLFFGKSANMIVNGVWDTKDYPKLDGRIEQYKTLYTMYYVTANMRFTLKLLYSRDTSLFVYIYPCTVEIKDTERIVDERYSLNPNTTRSFLHYRSKYDIILVKLLKERKIVVSDNMTGTNFFTLFDSNK